MLEYSTTYEHIICPACNENMGLVFFSLNTVNRAIIKQCKECPLYTYLNVIVNTITSKEYLIQFFTSNDYNNVLNQEQNLTPLSFNTYLCNNHVSITSKCPHCIQPIYICKDEVSDTYKIYHLLSEDDAEELCPFNVDELFKTNNNTISEFIERYKQFFQSNEHLNFLRNTIIKEL